MYSDEFYGGMTVFEFFRRNAMHSNKLELLIKSKIN